MARGTSQPVWPGTGDENRRKPGRALDGLDVSLYSMRITEEIRPWPSLACVKLIRPSLAGITA